MDKDSIFINTKQIDRLVIELKGFHKEVGEATCNALNRTIDHVITKVGQIVPKAYAIKAAEVKESFRGNVKRPSKTNLNVSIESRGHTLSFAHFPHLPQTPVIAQSLGSTHIKARVKVKIKKSSGNVPSKTGFIAKTGAKSADKVPFNVFHRIGKSRLPIAPIRTLSIPQMITNENVEEQILAAAQKKFDERLEHEIIYKMTSMDKKIRG
jgi:hypothetical protein